MAILTIVMLFTTFYFGTVYQANTDQNQIYALTTGTEQHLLSQGVFARSAPTGICEGSTCLGYQVSTGEFSLYLYLAPSSFDRLFADKQLIAQGYTPDCLSWCTGGIHYFLDPTYVITNYGRDFQQCKLFGSANTITCTSTDLAKYIYISSNSTTPAATDKWTGGGAGAGGGPCAGGQGSGEGLVTSNGADGGVATTITPGSPGATTTETLAITFSFTGAVSSTQAVCLLTEVRTGGNVILYGEGTFGPDTFGNGDSLTVTITDALT